MSQNMPLSKERHDRLTQALLIFGGEPAELLDDERLLEGGEHGLDRGGPDELCGLPVHDDELAEGAGAAQLAGDGHQDQIAVGAVIGGARDDDPGALLGGGLIGERKWHEHDVAELKTHGSRLARSWVC
jgi:hypothetical protein